MTIGSFQMTYIWHKFVVSFIQHHVISRFKIMNFVSLGFFMSCSDRHLPCFNERKNEQTNMDAMRKKNSQRLEYTSSWAYALLPSWKVRLRNLWSFILENFRTETVSRQHIKFLQKLRQSMYSWRRFNYCNTSAMERKTILIVIPGRFFREHDWAPKPQKRAKALARLYYLAQPKQPKPPCHLG